MTKHSFLLVAVRLDLIQAAYFTAKMKESGQTQSETLRKMIGDLMQIESDPWRYLQKNLSKRNPTVPQPTTVQQEIKPQ